MKASPKWFGRRTISVSCTLLDSSSRVICRNASEAISNFGNWWKAISKNLSKTFCPSAPSIVVLKICPFNRKPLSLVTYYTRYIKLWNVLYICTKRQKSNDLFNLQMWILKEQIERKNKTLNWEGEYIVMRYLNPENLVSGSKKTHFWDNTWPMLATSNIKWQGFIFSKHSDFFYLSHCLFFATPDTRFS